MAITRLVPPKVRERALAAWRAVERSLARAFPWVPRGWAVPLAAGVIVLMLLAAWILVSGLDTAHAGPAIPPGDPVPGSPADQATPDPGGEKEFSLAHYLGWLIDIPNLSDVGFGGLQGTIQNIAFAALSAVATLAVIHYWAAGFASQGGGAGTAVEVVARTGGAALFIVAWPALFDNASALSSLVSNALAHGAASIPTEGSPKADFDFSITGALLGGIITLIGQLLYSILILVLFVTKIGLTAALAALAIGMPLALSVWPVPGLAWIPTAMLRWCAAILCVPVAWAVCLRALDAILQDVLFRLGEGAGLDDKITRSLTWIAMFAVMLKVSGALLRAGGLTSGGGGMLSNFASFTLSHFAFNAAARHVPDALGGRSDTLARQQLWDRHHLESATERSGETRRHAWNESHQRSTGHDPDSRARSRQTRQAHSEHAAAHPERGPSTRTTAGRRAAEAAREQGLREASERTDAFRGAEDPPYVADSHIAQPANGGFTTIGAAGHEYGSLSSGAQADVSRAQWAHDSPETVSGELESIANEPGRDPADRDRILSLSRTDHDLRAMAIPGPSVAAATGDSNGSSTNRDDGTADS